MLERERARSDGQRALQVSPDRRGLGAIPSYQYQPPERTVAWYRAGYAGEVAYLDRAVSRLLAGLDERGLSESSLVVFTADHGESLGERDYWFAHGETLDESAVRVPLLIRAPGRGGSLRSEVASLVDVLPTVASLLGLVLDPPLSGFDLREPLPGRSVYFTTGRGAARRRDGIVQVPYKLVRARAMEGAQEELLLSRLSDPERATTAARPGRLRSLLLQLNGRSESLREADARAVD
jgi:arylsulfatase A-like enzyme